jgi:hypothetical protein
MAWTVQQLTRTWGASLLETGKSMQQFFHFSRVYSGDTSPAFVIPVAVQTG